MNDIILNGTMQLKLIDEVGSYSLLEQVNCSHPKFIVAYGITREKNECSWSSGNYIESIIINRHDVLKSAIECFNSKI